MTLPVIHAHLRVLDEFNKRLLSIQMRLESHDQHHADCSCNFCEAIYELSALRSELQKAGAL